MPAQQEVLVEAQTAIIGSSTDKYPQTSVCDRRDQHPDEVTVRFRRWYATALTAYQRGQFAGFLRPQAEALAARGIVELEPAARAPAQQRRDATRNMITK